jgi:predicted transcriptional regulator
MVLYKFALHIGGFMKDYSKFLNKFPKRYNLYYDNGLESINKNAESANYDIFIRILSDPVARISKGVKKFELRKYVPLHRGLVFMYETEKVQAITGCFYFKEFIAKPIHELWKIVGEKATKKEKFDNYFINKKYGVALEILDYQMFETPITSKELYTTFPDFPKSPEPYVYLYTKVGSTFSTFLRKCATDIIKRNDLCCKI